MTIVIEVARTEPPKNGKKLATVVTAAGEALGIWPDKLANLQPGHRYQVEVEENEFKGRVYRKISKVQAASAVASANSNGMASHAAAVGAGQAEGEFIARLLAAGVAAGAVDYTQADLTTAALMLRGVYRSALR